MSFTPKHVTSLPSVQDIEDELSKFNTVFGSFPRKAGKTQLDKVSGAENYSHNRYPIIDKYEQLNPKSILYYCATEDIALEIERVAILNLSSIGLSSNAFSDKNNRGAISSSDSMSVVYLTGMKNDEKKCPMCKFVGIASAVEAHIATHGFLVLIRKMKAVQEKMNLKPIAIQTDPIDYICGGFKTYECKYCSFQARHTAELELHIAKHERSTEMKERDFGHPCPYCEWKIKTVVERNRHMKLCKANPEYNGNQVTCKYCDVTLSQQRLLNRHQKTCKKNPNAQPQEFACGTCGMTFTRNDTRKRHIKIKHSN